MFPSSVRHFTAKFNGANFLEGIVTVLWIVSLLWSYLDSILEGPFKAENDDLHVL